MAGNAITAADALALIAEFGLQVKIGSEKTMAVFTVPRKVLLANISGAGGTLTSTEQSEKVVLMPGTLKRRPEIGDTVTANKEEFRVVDVETVEPNGVPVLFKVGVRR